jgi:hypothetical protein
MVSDRPSAMLAGAARTPAPIRRDSLYERVRSVAYHRRGCDTLLPTNDGLQSKE